MDGFVLNQNDYDNSESSILRMVGNDKKCSNLKSFKWEFGYLLYSKTYFNSYYFTWILKVLPFMP